MSLDEVLLDLIHRLGTDGDTLLGRELVQRWPEAAVHLFETAGWLKPAAPASSVECPGCPDQCWMPVHVLPPLEGRTSRAYIACDRREEIGRVTIPMGDLQQWQLTQGQVARWMSGALGLKSKPERDKATGHYKLGTVQGTKRVGEIVWVNADPVCLKSADHSRPLDELIFFEKGVLRLDRQAIQDVVDLPPIADSSQRYTPSTARREARKLDTQAMYESWRKEYRRLKREQPDQKDVWYSNKIAKLPIAMGRNSETIRKHMVK